MQTAYGQQGKRFYDNFDRNNPHLIVTRQVIFYLKTDSLIASIQAKINEKSFKSVTKLLFS